MKTPAPTLSNRAAAQFMRLREIQLREIQLGLRFLCACAHRGEGSPVLDSFPQALRARSRTFSTSKRLHSLLWSRRAFAPSFATGASSKSCSTPFTPSS